MEKWFIRNTNKNLDIDYKKLGINEIIYRLLLNRGLTSEDEMDLFLNPDIEKLYTPLLLKDLIKGANIIQSTIKSKKRIRIIGDYDVDGIMSTYILFTGLINIGATVDYVIPHRVSDGYGINSKIVEQAISDKVDLILTCDNGISAFDAIKLAEDNNVKVVVTDHHDVPKNIDNSDLIVPASAVINPKQEKCKYPFKAICGAAVAFKLIQHLYSISGIDDNKVFKDFLSFLTIATICDVMDLVDENRIIVKNGLNYIKNTTNLGLKTLIQECGIENKEVSVYHVGFVLGPTINSSGRLDSANKSLELFLSKDILEAERIAKELRSLNAKRQEMTDKGLKTVIDTIEKSNLINDKVLVVYEPTIHESIAGIIAGRIKEKYNLPTIILTQGREGIKGSGRSIESYNIVEEIARNKDLLNSFGGHPMAAGLSLQLENLDILRKNLNLKSNLSEDDLIKKIYIDYPLSIDQLSFEFIKKLKILEPFGNGNPSPLFGAKNLSVERAYILGKNSNVLKLLLKENNNSIYAISFENPIDFFNEIRAKYSSVQLENLRQGKDNDIKIDVVYTPEINEFNGNTSIQLKIKSYRMSR